MLRAKPVDTLMDLNVKLMLGQRESLTNPRKYKGLV